MKPPTTQTPSPAVYRPPTREELAASSLPPPAGWEQMDPDELEITMLRARLQRRAAQRGAQEQQAPC
jgi:hypothetical protein